MVGSVPEESKGVTHQIRDGVSEALGKLHSVPLQEQHSSHLKPPSVPPPPHAGYQGVLEGGSVREEGKRMQDRGVSKGACLACGGGGRAKNILEG